MEIIAYKLQPSKHFIYLISSNEIDIKFENAKKFKKYVEKLYPSYNIMVKYHGNKRKIS